MQFVGDIETIWLIFIPSYIANPLIHKWIDLKAKKTLQTHKLLFTKNYQESHCYCLCNDKYLS